jgi:hypothetical protein
LKSPATEAELFVEVPSAAGKFVTLRLTVDDYPRAIFFRVPCSGETSDVPEDLDLPRLTSRSCPRDDLQAAAAGDSGAACDRQPRRQR